MRLIDADRLKTYYDHTCTSGGKFGDAQLKIIEWAKDIVDSCNTIDAEPVRHGRWKFEYSLNMNYCSECGWGMVKGERRKYNHCPNCGAKMGANEE